MPTDESVLDPGKEAWEALAPREQESLCKISDGSSAENAAETLEFFGKNARPRTFDMSEEAHADRVALIKYAQANCNPKEGG